MRTIHGKRRFRQHLLEGCTFQSNGIVPPDFPRCPPFGVKLVEVLFVLERVHRGRESVVRVREQLIGCYQTIERFLNQLLTRTHIVKDLATKQEESAVDSEV